MTRAERFLYACACFKRRVYGEKNSRPSPHSSQRDAARVDRRPVPRPVLVSFARGRQGWGTGNWPLTRKQSAGAVRRKDLRYRAIGRRLFQEPSDRMVSRRPLDLRKNLNNPRKAAPPRTPCQGSYGVMRIRTGLVSASRRLWRPNQVDRSFPATARKNWSKSTPGGESQPFQQLLPSSKSADRNHNYHKSFAMKSYTQWKPPFGGT